MLKCSHILCKVNRIADAVRDFQKLGFNVTWGSDPARAHNALLWFERGPFVELFQIPRAAAYLRHPLGWFYGQAAGSRWHSWSEADKGWCDVALEPVRNALPERSGAEANRQELQRVREEAERLGIAASRIMNGKRVRPDGQIVKYSLFVPKPAGLPFVVSHYDPPQRPDRIAHPNGASGIAWVRYGVPEAGASHLRKLASGDEWLIAETSENSGVIEVGVHGLRERLDPALAHGALMVPADRPASRIPSLKEENER